MAIDLGAAKNSRKLAVNIALGAVLLLVTFLGYLMSIASPPMLDEQFILTWLQEGRAAASAGGFLSFRGFDVLDMWGPLTQVTFIVLGSMGAFSATALKLSSLFFHFVAVASLFVISRGITRSEFTAFGAALIFAVYPLNAEAIGWLGGFGIGLSGALSLLSFAAYIEARRRGLAAGLLATAVVAYILALLASTLSAIFAPVFVLYELFFYFGNSFGAKGDTDQVSSQSAASARLSIALIGPLLMIVLAGVSCAINLDSTLLSRIDFSWEAVGGLLKNVFLPINEHYWRGYARQYVIGYVLLILIGLSGLSLACIARTKASQFLFSFLWLFTVLVPVLGFVGLSSDCYGSRWLYFAAAPLSLLLANATSGLIALRSAKSFSWLPAAFGMVLNLTLAVFLFAHLWNSNAAYRNVARTARNIQKSLAIVQAKENCQYAILSDLPDRLSILPAFSPKEAAIFHAPSGLLSSGTVSGGALKDRLFESKHLNTTLRWEKDLGSFIPLDLGNSHSTWPNNMSVDDLAARLQPGLMFYKNVSKDSAEKCLILETNSEHGPMIQLMGSELSPIDGDFMAVVAKINAPEASAKPRIELHWCTSEHKDYDNSKRRVDCRAFVNDNQYHTYLLPLRTSAFTTGGRLQQIALGFPAGSKVWLRSVGVVDSATLMPEFKIAADASESLEAKRFNPPFYNYPSRKDLGLIALAKGAQELKIDYSLQNIPGAAGGIVEISSAGKTFPSANSTAVSSSGMKVEKVQELSGSFVVKISELGGPGVYQFRMAAVDASGNILGVFSDAVSCAVP